MGAIKTNSILIWSIFQCHFLQFHATFGFTFVTVMIHSLKNGLCKNSLMLVKIVRKCHPGGLGSLKMTQETVGGVPSPV